MRNWNTQQTPWLAHSTKLWNGSAFLTFIKKTFYFHFQQEPTLEEVQAFISSRGYELADLRPLGLGSKKNKPAYLFEAFVRKQ